MEGNQNNVIDSSLNKEIITGIKKLVEIGYFRGVDDILDMLRDEIDKAKLFSDYSLCSMFYKRIVKLVDDLSDKSKNINNEEV